MYKNNDYLFIVEHKNELSKIHEISLRSLYLPIIGTDATTFYSILTDYHTLYKGNPSFIHLDDVAKTLQVSMIDLLQLKEKLEAVGLIRTFEKSDNLHLMFILNLPLIPSEFKKNYILFKSALEKIDEICFERVFFGTKNMELNKDEYIEKTSKYQDVFGLVQTQNTNSTIEIPIREFANTQEAIKGLTSAQFVKFLTTKKVNETQIALFQRLDNMGFCSQTINEIIYYTYERSGKIVNNYIESIANDFSKKDFMTYEIVVQELGNAKENQTLKSLSYIPELDNKKLDVIEENDSLSWSNIFDSLGGEL